MDVKEYAVPVDKLPSVRMKQWLDKKSGAFPYGWRQRFFVLAGNMLCMYVNQAEAKPKKVVCMDGVTMEVSTASLFVWRRRVG